MTQIVTGYKRSLKIVVNKTIDGILAAGYPKYYPTALDVLNGYFTLNGINYSIPSQEQLGLMEQSEYDVLLLRFKQYVSLHEPDLSFSSDFINLPEVYAPDECYGITTTSTSSSTTTTTEEVVVTTTTTEEVIVTTTTTEEVVATTTTTELATTTTTLEQTTTTTSSSTTSTTTINETICGYGLLYNWYAATDVRNIANEGWRVATGDLNWPAFSGDWGILMKYLDPAGTSYASTVAGIKMKEESPDYWSYWGNLEIGTNESGFNGRGSGSRQYSIGGFPNLGSSSSYWAKSYWDEPINDLYSTSTLGWSASFQAPILGGGTNLLQPTAGVSIRLVKESTTLSHGQTGEYIGNDGTVYQTICIGTQEWLAENLRETKYRNGDIIPEVTDNAEWASLTTGALCAYDNDWSNACMEKPDYY